MKYRLVRLLKYLLALLLVTLISSFCIFSTDWMLFADLNEFLVSNEFLVAKNVSKIANFRQYLNFLTVSNRSLSVLSFIKQVLRNLF